LRATGDANEERANRLEQASAHWLRHSAGSHMADQQVDLRLVRDNLGHASSQRRVSTSTSTTIGDTAKLRKSIESNGEAAATSAQVVAPEDARYIALADNAFARDNSGIATSYLYIDWGGGRQNVGRLASFSKLIFMYTSCVPANTRPSYSPKFASRDQSLLPLRRVMLLKKSITLIMSS
jgi:hypothetical protein